MCRARPIVNIAAVVMPIRSNVRFIASQYGTATIHQPTRAVNAKICHRRN
jgi:hypothetical protein